MTDEKRDWMRSAEVARAEGDYKAMRACAREILELETGDLEALCIFAEATLLAGEVEEAKKRIVEIRLRSPQHLYGMMVEAEISYAEFKLKETASLLRGVVAVASESAEPWAEKFKLRAMGLLSDVYQLAAEPENAARQLFELSTAAAGAAEKADYYSKALFVTNYRYLPPEKTLALHRGYNAFFRAKMTFPHKKSEAHGSKLRIGYISPDFRQHAAAYFFAPFFKNYSRQDFIVYAYNMGPVDTVTKRMQRFPVHWRDFGGLTALEAARRIFADHIDILVDLSGHTQNSCLPVLTYRPAPVQVSGIGYMNTTGLNEVDYFISDTHCLPLSETVQGFSEKPMRLAHSHLCYSPWTVKNMPEPGRVPAAESNGYITFGSFNNFCKASPEVLGLWRAVIEMVPNSRLVIKSKICSIESGREIVKDRLKEVGLDVERVELRPYSPDYLEQYRDIDIALDTFPYNGGLTTCEALFMGVPVVTLYGRTHASRFGASLLENAGLPELVAKNEAEYVNKAAKIALTPEILAGYHKNLRRSLQHSPLMNGEAYLKDLEAEYRRIWRESMG